MIIDLLIMTKRNIEIKLKSPFLQYIFHSLVVAFEGKDADSEEII